MNRFIGLIDFGGGGLGEAGFWSRALGGRLKAKEGGGVTMSAFDFMSGEAPPAAEDAEEQPGELRRLASLWFGLNDVGLAGEVYVGGEGGAGGAPTLADVHRSGVVGW